jgi:hypothetical protein
VTEQTSQRLWAVVAFIAQLARGNGLLGQMRRAGNSVPSDETANYLKNAGYRRNDLPEPI